MEIDIQQDAETFIASLEPQTIAKILRTIDLLEQFGYKLGMPHCKKVADYLFELRVRGQQEVRIFYTVHKKYSYIASWFCEEIKPHSLS